MTDFYKVVLFDCNGVIVDDENISKEIMQSILSQYGLELNDKILHTALENYRLYQPIKLASRSIIR